MHCSVAVPGRIERSRNALGQSYPAHVNRFLTLRKLVEPKRYWQRQRLSSTSRAGLYGTNEVRKVHRRWLRENARLLTCSVGVTAIMFGLILFILPPWLRGFMAGVFTTTLVANVAYMMVVSTGTVPRLAGIDAEKSMARDLRSLEKHGWTVANHLLLEKGEGDVDHLLIGPAGLVVVETKWTSTWSDSAGWCSKVAEGTRHRTSAVSRNIAQLKLPTHSIVAVWGPAAHMVGASAAANSKCSVLPGTKVVSHILALPAAETDASHFATARRNLDLYVAQRDKGEQAFDPRVRALWEPAADLLIAVQVAVAVLVIAGSTIRIKPEGLWTASLAGIGLVGSLVIRRKFGLSDRIRASAVGVAVMSGALLVLVGVAAVISVL
jgi:Nuclease-related domain